MFFLLVNQTNLLPSQTETDRQGVTVWISSGRAVPGGADINKGGQAVRHHLTGIRAELVAAPPQKKRHYLSEEILTVT